MLFFWTLTKITYAGDPIGILSIPNLAASFDKDAKVQTDSLRPQDFKTVEFDYEELGIYVVEKIKNKLRLLKSDGSTTIIDMPKLGKFYSIEQLLSGEKLFWVKADVTFYSEPGSISTVHKPIKLTRNIIGLYELGPQQVSIYSGPSSNSEILRKISKNSPWVSQMQGSCPCGVIISERKGEWLKVSDVRGERSELLSSEGWIFSDGKTKLEPIINPDQLREAQDIIYKDKLQDLPVKVLETRVIDSRLWAKVTYDLKERCGPSVELGSIPINIFWVRVFTDDTKLNHWYHPRGC